MAKGETLKVPAELVVPPWFVSAGLNCVVDTVIVEPSAITGVDAASRSTAARNRAVVERTIVQRMK